MSKTFNVKFILHFVKNPEKNIYLSLLRIKKQIKNTDIINFEIPLDRFNDFQAFLPAKLNILNENGNIIRDYTLNLLKGNNTYHLFNGYIFLLFELLFYNEDTVKISVDDIEIKDYDQCSKFKRFGLINLNNKIIKVNDIEVNLEDFVPNISENSNSFHFSFYNITKKYIVSKNIRIPQKRNISNYYEKEYDVLTEFSKSLFDLKKEIEINKNESYFNKKYEKLFEKYFFYLVTLKELNLFYQKNIFKI